MPAAPAAKSARALVKTALRMMEPPFASADCPGGDAFGKHAPPVCTVLVRAHVVIRPFCDSTLGVQPDGCKGRAEKVVDRRVKAPDGPPDPFVTGAPAASRPRRYLGHANCVG